MGAMALQTMRDHVRFIAGGYTDTVLTDTTVDTWLRWAQLHISRPNIYEHRELFTSGTIALVAGTRNYAFTGFGTSNDNVQAVALVVNETRGNRLRPLTLRQIEEGSRSGSTVLAGRPTTYALLGTSIYLHPAPNTQHNGDTVRVWFWRKPTALAATPATELAEEWDEVIVAGAVWRAFRYLNVQDRAEIAKVEFAQLTNEIGDRLRADMQQDSADRRFDIEVHDYQQESF